MNTGQAKRVGKIELACRQWTLFPTNVAVFVALAGRRPPVPMLVTLSVDGRETYFKTELPREFQPS